MVELSGLEDPDRKSERRLTMSHRTLAGLIIALLASSGQSEAQPAAVEVSLVSVSPGTPSGDGDWCIGAERVMLTAHVVDLASQSEVTEGTIVWQVCQSPLLGGLPKEDCDGHGPARWAGAVISDLSFDSTPSIGTSPLVPVLGFRLQYRPAPGSGFKRATSESFNLDKTCSP
jgi:hypothetical protein